MHSGAIDLNISAPDDFAPPKPRDERKPAPEAPTPAPEDAALVVEVAEVPALEQEQVEDAAPPVPPPAEVAEVPAPENIKALVLRRSCMAFKEFLNVDETELEHWLELMKELPQQRQDKINKVAREGLGVCSSCWYKSGCPACDPVRALRYHLSKLQFTAPAKGQRVQVVRVDEPSRSAPLTGSGGHQDQRF